MVLLDACYTLVGAEDSSETPSFNDLRNGLEKGNEKLKIETMKKILVLMINGEAMSQLLMHVIRFVMPSQQKMLKKLMLLFFEICPKTNTDGTLKQEWILVCNALRNDLQHPNEYVRGVTLRFICKLKELELLEPLAPSIRQCLEHRHPYVRRNAVFALASVYKQVEHLIPDAPEVLFEFISKESDMSCKRNAFHMLYSIDQQKAVQYLVSTIDKVPSFDDHLQLAVVELIHKDCLTNLTEKPRYIKCIFGLLNSNSAAVKYDCANTLVSLTAAPVAIKACASCYIDLAVKQSDNNVKLIVLERFRNLQKQNKRLLDDLAVDLLRVLSSPDAQVRQKVLDTILEMTGGKNVGDIISFFKKEVIRVQEDVSANSEYLQMLIKALHDCSIRYSELAVDACQLLVQYIAETPVAAVSSETIHFIREVLERYPEARADISKSVMNQLKDINIGKIARGALWILGEYCETEALIDEGFNAIRKSIGGIPILETETQSAEDLTQVNETGGGARRILPDGTYATESALMTTKDKQKVASKKPSLRKLLLEGDFFMASVLASTLLKFIARLRHTIKTKDAKKLNYLSAEAMLILSSVVRVGKSSLVSGQIDENNYERVLFAIKEISKPVSQVDYLVLQGKKTFLNSILGDDPAKQEIHEQKQKEVPEKQIDFRLFQAKSLNQGGDFELDLVNAAKVGDDSDLKSSKLDRIVQLTGFSDPIYAEAYVNIHQYDIAIDVLVVNQTSETFQNLTLELSTLGDLKLVERPGTYTLAPRGFLSIKATIKVSSSDNGVIFGNIVYDCGTESVTVVLNSISIDILEYIKPATCSDSKYRTMWLEFEWENKITVKTNLSDLEEYMNIIIKNTNMKCLTQSAATDDFLAANLYARSIFGEDLVANISLEKLNGQIGGHIRIRTKTQGFAYSVGEKITAIQKTLMQ